MAVHGIARDGLIEMREVFEKPANHANQMTEVVYKKESYAIIGACFEVYNGKGCGFLEPVYQECLAIEFEYQRILFALIRVVRGLI
jgi:PD-(D/E)XK nuclease superfamily